MTGYKAPNHTQMPNELLDRHLPLMKEAELKVVLVIARKTFGWHKPSDRISLTQLQRLTGLSRQGVINGIADAIKRGVIEKVDHNIGAHEYSLVVNEVDQLVNEVDSFVVNEVDTQKKVVKETKQKDNAAVYNIFTEYENNIGTLSPFVGESLGNLADEYSDEWVVLAIQEAARQNVRKLSYVIGILKGCKDEGHKPGQNGYKPARKPAQEEGTPIKRKMIR